MKRLYDVDNSYELIKYIDFKQMIEDMQDYVASTKSKLAIKDDGVHLRIGFVDEINKKWFVIRIADIKSSRETMTAEEAESNKYILSNEDGKLSLLDTINRSIGE